MAGIKFDAFVQAYSPPVHQAQQAKPQAIVNKREQDDSWKVVTGNVGEVVFDSYVAVTAENLAELTKTATELNFGQPLAVGDVLIPGADGDIMVGKTGEGNATMQQIATALLVEDAMPSPIQFN